MQEIPQGFFLAFTVFLGLVLGSFATALAYRVPRGLSIVKMKRSACPSCHRNLTAIDLVPVFSWLFLKGKCRTCKAPIGWQYPLIEVATLGLCLAFYARFGFTVETLPFFALAPVITSLVAIDIEFMILPDGLNLSILGLGVAGLFAGASQSPEAVTYIIEKGEIALAGLAAYAVFFIALRAAVMFALKKDPLGGGDIKFFAAAGFWLGLNPYAAAGIAFFAGFFGIVLALGWKKIKKEAEFPFGPALLAAFVAMLVWQGAVFMNI